MNKSFPAYIPQYGYGISFVVWAAAALPMGVLAWLVAPAVKDSFAGRA